MADDILTDSVEIRGQGGTKIRLRTVHILDPVPWSENPEGVRENYYIIDEGKGTSALIQVASYSPFRLEQLDLTTPRGAEHWHRLQSSLAKSDR